MAAPLHLSIQGSPRPVCCQAQRSTDGNGAGAMFAGPANIVVGSHGRVLFMNHLMIRKTSPDTVVTTSTASDNGAIDGLGITPKSKRLYGLTRMRQIRCACAMPMEPRSEKSHLRVLCLPLPHPAPRAVWAALAQTRHSLRLCPLRWTRMAKFMPAIPATKPSAN